MSEAPWHIACEVTLTPAEVAKASALATSRAKQRKFQAGWGLFIAAVAGGFILALLAVLAGVVRPDRAGGLAVGGFLACWAGMWLQWLALKNYRRAAQLEGWQGIDWRYTITLSAAGIRCDIPGRSLWIAWWRVTQVEGVAGQVRLWGDRRTLLIMPDRCLPLDWPVAEVVARLTDCIRNARRPGPDQARQ